MTIAVRGVGTPTSQTGGASQAIPLYSGWQPGDISLGFFGASFSTGSSPRQAISSPWAFFETHNSASQAWGFRVMSASESNPTVTYTETTSTGNDETGCIVDIYGAALTGSGESGLDNAAYLQSTNASSGNGAAYSAFTPTVNNCIVFVMGSCNYPFTSSTPSTGGTWAKAFDAQSAGSGTDFFCWWQIQTTATAISAGAVGLTGAGTSQTCNVLVFSVQAIASGKGLLQLSNQGGF